MAPISSPIGEALPREFWPAIKGGPLFACRECPGNWRPCSKKKWSPGFLASTGDKRVIKSRMLLLTGLGESAAEAAIADIIKEQTNPTIASYAGLGEVRLRLTAAAAGAEEALALIEPLEAKLRERLGDAVYGVDSDTLEGVVAEKLIKGGLVLAVAESCTGGLVSHRLTNIPGSSAFFRQGLIVYSNEAKKELLDVPDELLEEYGAVSPQVAEAMAKEVRLVGDADLGLAITGIAGPGGATPTKPVGLVYLALAPDGECLVEKHTFSGQREEVKYRASQAALNLLAPAPAMMISDSRQKRLLPILAALVGALLLLNLAGSLSYRVGALQIEMRAKLLAGLAGKPAWPFLP